MASALCVAQELVQRAILARLLEMSGPRTPHVSNKFSVPGQG